MQSERIYLVWAHPRHDSLTANIADAIHQRAMERKIQVTELDLYRRNFNPVMTSEDEPDWKNMDKRRPTTVLPAERNAPALPARPDTLLIKNRGWHRQIDTKSQRVPPLPHAVSGEY